MQAVLKAQIKSKICRDCCAKDARLSPAIHFNGHCESVAAADRSRDDDARPHAARMGAQAAAAVTFRRWRPL
jgi:hypothetical protein